VRCHRNPDGGVRAERSSQGTPEDAAVKPRSYTGQYLRPMLEKVRVAAELSGPAFLDSQN
jgi:excinuclease ABC subunit A